MPSDGVVDHKASEVESGVSGESLSLDNVLTTFARRIHAHITAVISWRELVPCHPMDAGHS
jgi:hypothetical protein